MSRLLGILLLAATCCSLVTGYPGGEKATDVKEATGEAAVPSSTHGEATTSTPLGVIMNKLSVPPQPPNTDTTTAVPTTKPTIKPTNAPPTTTTTTTTTIAPTTTTTTTTTTTPAPYTTTVTPPPTSTTTKPAPSPPTIKPTAAPDITTTSSPTPAPSNGRHFDGLSFLGGIVLTVCLVGMSGGLYQFYKIKTERSYRTL